ncbi:Elicitor peptide [Arabidopsis thaliana x Arabidopsis arenosa]|uniref:Elicitor peptide n=1 Tax=Arabidopsis thaliana x Arabidopsis arenosa TaxID=1240361 RepID=A0A8T1YVK3_9BRAS|nr:Elicitor peptide [Arabidopsis thaliana x Arabidopsis arenosa]
MEEERRNEEESSHLCIPFQFLNESLKTFLKCIGLHLSPSPSISSASSEEATHDVVSARGGMIVKSKKTLPSSGKPGRRN